MQRLPAAIGDVLGSWASESHDGHESHADRARSGWTAQ
jgi:hypothetical protein